MDMRDGDCVRDVHVHVQRARAACACEEMLCVMYDVITYEIGGSLLPMAMR